MKKSCCFASQQLRGLINQGKILVPSFDESRIQPSSYEPTIGDEIFVIDTETSGLFRPTRNNQVYRSLLELPKRRRQKFNLSGGFEVKKGFSYLLPLETRIKLTEDEYIKSSPKSSFGRLFLNSRLLTDYNDCFDEVHGNFHPGKEIGSWLLSQPLNFNVILHPGVALTQLRWSTGQGAKLTPNEINQEIFNNPILYTLDDNGSLKPTDHVVTDGLQVHLNLSGKHTFGIVGLRARNNPVPIDVTKEHFYEAEDFFEPLKAKNGRLKKQKGECCLFGSHQVVKIPPYLNAEMRDHSHVGLLGPLHFAGFFDNNFCGDAVYEIPSGEMADMELVDRMPITLFDFFRTAIPDKLYGPSIGSHYYGQVGPLPPKFFKNFDFAYAAKNYQKLDRDVLVQDAKILMQHRKRKGGFEILSPDTASGLFNDIENGFFQSRYDCEAKEGSEGDVLAPQIIPYVLFFGSKNDIFTYVRAKDIKQYGETGLFGKHSICPGGHIIKDDYPHYINRCLEREVMEEVEIIGNHSEPKLVGTLMAYDEPVDRVHFGLVFVSHVDGYIKQKESSATSSGMVPIKQLMKNNSEKYETWSRVLIPYLVELSKY